jgi:hypothetical protein
LIRQALTTLGEQRLQPLFLKAAHPHRSQRPGGAKRSTNGRTGRQRPSARSSEHQPSTTRGGPRRLRRRRR